MVAVNLTSGRYSEVVVNSGLAVWLPIYIFSKFLLPSSLYEYLEVNSVAKNENNCIL